MFRMTAMDHIVLNVENMDTVLDFYVNVLGLEPERLEEFRQGKVGFPSVLSVPIR
jgi:catechol 2,3-dioxygenase-like lactoylglutathione lyase family enzyme